MSWIWTGGDLADQEFLRGQRPEKRPEGRSGTRRRTSPPSLRPPIELFDGEAGSPREMRLVWGGIALFLMAFWGVVALAVISISGSA